MLAAFSASSWETRVGISGWIPIPQPLPNSKLLLLLLRRSVMSDSLRPHGLKASRLLCPRDFPGKNTGVGCHFLLQVIYMLK